MAGEDVEPVANIIEECGGTLLLTLNDTDHGSQFRIDRSWYYTITLIFLMVYNKYTTPELYLTHHFRFLEAFYQIFNPAIAKVLKTRRFGCCTPNSL